VNGPGDDVLRALLAGLVAGSVVAFGSTAIAILALWRSRRVLLRVAAAAIPLRLLGVVFVNGFLLGWTALGLVLGASLHVVEGVRPGAGLGSPNAAFTAGVLAAVVAALVAASVVRGRPGSVVTSIAALSAVSFGWLLPWLGL
jgi:hypothetical protein